MFLSQVDNFVECEDEESEDEESISNVDSVLEDGIFTSGYSPSAVTSSNSLKHVEDTKSAARDMPANADLGIEATKEICYLPGNG